MGSKSELYSFRLHPNDQREADAIEIINGLQADGFSVRQIVTDAILRAKGHRPEMYRTHDDAITKGYIEQTLEDFAGHLMTELRANGSMVQPQSDSEKSPFDSDEDSEMARNLADGYLARRKRG